MRNVLNLFIVGLLLLFSLPLIGENSPAELFSFDENKITNEFQELQQLENLVLSNQSSDKTNFDNLSKIIVFSGQNLFQPRETLAPWGIPSFWWSFTIGLIGTYTLYGAGLGPVSVAVVYLVTNGNMEETKKSAWGCLVGSVIGGVFKYASIQ